MNGLTVPSSFFCLEAPATDQLPEPARHCGILRGLGSFSLAAVAVQPSSSNVRAHHL